MSISFRLLSGFVCVAAGAVWAQQGRISGPTSGFVFDRSTRTVRPVLGVPGGSTIGSAIDFGRPLAAAWVAPRVAPGVGSTIGIAADGSLHFFRIDAGLVSSQEIHGVEGSADNVVFSPMGSSAVVFSGQAIHVVTGMPDAPQVAGMIHLGTIARRGGPATVGMRSRAPQVSVAVSDDGAYVLYGSAGMVRVLTVSGENRQLASAGADAVVAFAPGSHDAAVADSETGVMLYRNLAGAASPKLLAADVTEPSGLAFSADGQKLFLASAAGHSVTAFDVEAESRITVACNCSPVSLVRMGKLYRLNELGREPLWVLDAEAKDPRIMFVPAAVN